MPSNLWLQAYPSSRRSASFRCVSEVALDHLLVGTCGGQRTTGLVDVGEPARMNRAHARVLRDGVVERAAAARDVAIGEGQRMCRARLEHTACSA
jgi:hypothetical protein